MDGMAKQKPKPAATYDARAEHKPIRIRGVLVPYALDHAAELAEDLTQYVNEAVREKLERAGKWPPPPPKPPAK